MNFTEEQLATWAAPPSESERQRMENAERAVCNAISTSAKLNKRTIRVFAQGSYRNRVNVRQDSDVDVAVLCTDTFFWDGLPSATLDSLGFSDATRRGELRRISSRVIGYKPEGDKELRVEVQTGKLEQGLIVLPKEAPFLKDLRRELLAFPEAAHNDQVDALTQFLHWAGGRGTGLMNRDPLTLRPLGRPRPPGRPFHRRAFVG